MASYSSFGCFSVLYEVSSCFSCVLLWRSRSVQSAWGKESFHSLVNCSFRGESQCFKSVQVSSPAAKNISLLSVFWRSRSLLLTRRDWRRTWVRHMKREVRGVFFFFWFILISFFQSRVFSCRSCCVFSLSVTWDSHRKSEPRNTPAKIMRNKWMSTRLITDWFCRDRQNSGEEFSKIK